MLVHHPYAYYTPDRLVQRGRLAVTEPANGNVVPLDDIKMHLRVDHDDEDSYILGLVEAAAQQIDMPRGWLGRSLLERTMRLTLDDIPPPTIYLPGPPILEVVSVEYRDQDDALQTIDAADYTVDLLAEPGLIWAKRDNGVWLRESWNVSMMGGPDTFRVTYRAGYPTAQEIPRLIRQWIMCQAANLYRDREGTIIGTTASPFEHIERALDNLRVR